LSSIILMIVTIIYVVITQKILQVPNQAFVKPIGQIPSLACGGTRGGSSSRRAFDKGVRVSEI
jgi:hypothetical protein